MVDISAVLDSAGAGVAATGKKGAKDATSGPGDPGAQAGFIAVLMAQAGADGAIRGPVSELRALVAGAATLDKAQTAGLQPVSDLPRATVWQAGDASGLVQAHARFPEGAASSALPDQGLRPAGQAIPPQAERLARDLPEVVAGVQPNLPGQAALARLNQTPDWASDPMAEVLASESETLAMAVVGLPQALSSVPSLQGAVADEASLATAASEIPVEFGGRDDLARMLAAEGRRPGPDAAREAATSALSAGNLAQDLPSASPAGNEALQGIDLPAELLATESTGGASLPSLPGAQAPVQDVSVLRPFDHALRQVEARLNLSVEAPVRSPVFAQELGEKMIWLAGRQGQVAEMVLNPPQLGTLEVRLTLSGGEAGAQFYSANPVVRETIESALPRLRDMLAQAGINLGEANVRDQSLRQDARAEGNGALRPNLPGGVEGQPEGALALATFRSQGRGLVDLYA